MNAVRIECGNDVILLNKETIEWELTTFVNDLLFTVVDSAPEPTASRPTIIDTTFKVFTNQGWKANDETTVQVGKNAPAVAGTRYHFFIEQGVSFDHKQNLGVQIVSLSMSGGHMRVGAPIEAKDEQYNIALQFQYRNEEKIVVPPRTKVTASIKTSTTKYSQAYTLEFSIPRSRFIHVVYFTKAQKWIRRICCGCKSCFCCCCKPKEKLIYAADLLQTLPNFMDRADGYCSFTLNGTLTWIGEGCSVDKLEAQLP